MALSPIGTVPAGTPAPIGGGFNRDAVKWQSLYVTQNGKLVTMKVANMTDAQIKAALGMQANSGALADGWQRLSNGQIAKAPTPPAATPATNTPAAAAPAAPGIPASLTLDPRDGDYQNQMAQYAFDRDRAVAEQESFRKTLPSLFNRGAQDIRRGYDRDRFDSNAELASRGIVRSGEYQRRGADRAMQNARLTADLDSQYGTGAQSKISARLAEINQQYGIQSQGALSSAKSRYQDRYPASSYIWQGG